MSRGLVRYPFPLWFLYPAVLLSGFTALVYEIVWARRLALVLGSATSAASAVLSAFMFGLAAGALLVGRRTDASRRPLRWYGVLEIGIGIYALAFESLLGVAEGFLASHPWLCSFALLTVPAALMGGTLPVLARAASDTTQRGTRAFGSLYGVNTLGAVIGALFTALVLLESLGLAGSTRLAAILNIALGAGFWLLGTLAGDRDLYVAPEEAPRPRALGDAEPLIIAAFFLAGFAALGLEMAWFRLLVYYLEGFTIAFGLMLAAYLLGLGAGALGGTWLALLAKNPRRLLARILLAEAVLAVATFLLVSGLGDSLETMRGGYRLSDAIDSAYAGRLFWTALAIVFPATFCAGMLMPIVARIALADREAIGLHTGTVYAASTLGAVLAPPVAGFWLLPALGVPHTIALLAALVLVAGTAVAFGRGLREWAFAGGGAVAFVAVCLAAGLGTPLVERSHVFRSGKPRRLLHASSGELCDVAVVADLADGSRRLYVDGFSAAETGAQYAYMRMQGHLPVLLHGKPERVLVIAFGTGTTAGAVASHADVKEIVCVEIEPLVYDAAGFFAAVNRDVLADGRVRKVIADGREYIRRGGAFDIITLEPLMPYTPMAVHLYTKEFYELALKALNEDGMLCQWIPPQGVSGADFRRLVASATAAFDHVSLWYFPHAVLMIGGRAEPRLNRLIERANTPRMLEDLRFAGVEDAAHLLGTHVVSGPALAAALKGVEPMVDDRPDLEFRPLARGLGRKSVQCHAEVLEFLREHHQAEVPWLTGEGDGVIAGVPAALATGREILGLLARDRRFRVDPEAEGVQPPTSGEFEALVARDPKSLFARILHDTVRYVELMQVVSFDEAAKLTLAPDRSRAYLGLAKGATGDARRFYLTLALHQNGLLDPGERRVSAEMLDELAQGLDGAEKRFCENRARFLRDQPWQEGEEACPKVAMPDIRAALEQQDEDAARAVLERARQADLGDAVDRAAWEWYEAEADKRAGFRLLLAIGSKHTRAAAKLLLDGDAEDNVAVAGYYCSVYPGTRLWAEMLCTSVHPQVREAAADAAKACGTRSHLAALVALCSDQEQGVRLSAFISFREIEPRAGGTGYDPDAPSEAALKALGALVDGPQAAVK